MKDEIPKSLILIRHAHRDTNSGRGLDNGLSPKGRKQAKRIGRLFEAEFGKNSRPVLLSSPKQRCLETLAAISGVTQTAVAIDPLLDEGGDVTRHVRSFLTAWKRSSAHLTVGASHGDWIPEAIRQLWGLGIDIDKGGWLEIRLEGDDFKLHRLIQEP